MTTVTPLKSFFYWYKYWGKWTFKAIEILTFSPLLSSFDVIRLAIAILCFVYVQMVATKVVSPYIFREDITMQ